MAALLKVLCSFCFTSLGKKMTEEGKKWACPSCQAKAKAMNIDLKTWYAQLEQKAEKWFLDKFDNQQLRYSQQQKLWELDRDNDIDKRIDNMWSSETMNNLFTLGDLPSMVRMLAEANDIYVELDNDTYEVNKEIRPMPAECCMKQELGEPDEDYRDTDSEDALDHASDSIDEDYIEEGEEEDAYRRDAQDFNDTPTVPWVVLNWAEFEYSTNEDNELEKERIECASDMPFQGSFGACHLITFGLVLQIIEAIKAGLITTPKECYDSLDCAREEFETLYADNYLLDTQWRHMSMRVWEIFGQEWFRRDPAGYKIWRAKKLTQALQAMGYDITIGPNSLSRFCRDMKQLNALVDLIQVDAPKDNNPICENCGNKLQKRESLGDFWPCTKCQASDHASNCMI